MRDFLVEIHTEELPPKSLQRLANHFLNETQKLLIEEALTFDNIKSYATPRRLALYVKNLSNKQPDSTIERKGPARHAAFDDKGNPTQSCIGFAKSCGVSPKELIIIKNSQGEWVGFKQKIKGKKTEELIPNIVDRALNALPIAKRMRWGTGGVEFVRPVHSVILMYDKKIIHATLLGCKTNRKTRGHRFLSKGWITIPHPEQYESLLEKHHVIVDFEKRRETIKHLAEEAIRKIKNASIMMSEDLLDEVTGLVEWPYAITGRFDEHFLKIPQEVLISSMQDHQRYFPVIEKDGKLLNYFITISNIKSKDPEKVIAGNERVLRARLADAAFFFEVDKKRKLIDRIPILKGMVFQQKLGSLYDKAERLSILTAKITEELGGSAIKGKRAGLLAKADLTTELVHEFPELQGIAGSHYAIAEQLPVEIAEALYEQYLPRFAKDRLPVTLIGSALAIADRLDTLVGIFGINHQPTGDKDPYGLRRAALGILRILIDKHYNLDLNKLISMTAESYGPLENQNVTAEVMNFMLERLKPWYQEKGISYDVLASVIALNVTKPYDLHRRIIAVEEFKKYPDAQALAIANKRVSNILSKYKELVYAANINPALFETEIEKRLSELLQNQSEKIASLSEQGQYKEVLSLLATFREPIDVFFDKVLVITDDQPRRDNRLLLLKKLRQLFLNVADIALLQ